MYREDGKVKCHKKHTLLIVILTLLILREYIIYD